MVTRFGMSEAIGPITVADEDQRFLGGRLVRTDVSEETGTTIDREVKRLIEQAKSRAHGILTEHRGDLDRVVALLLDQEVLEREDLERVLDAREPRSA